ncbi:conserved unknown protein [Ectocarpus siliculosus]|uniref:Plastid lipid-associated protein/fibrillin conserved domain-containing protein n=1 Tax=Ectocarpus siliculosus TaxID=2880 RepID=D8LT52_ECTSI|nr:conserved unknown protein [Ectocarpus siliculosus]|eukprot:CBN75326.1 conserved unknown protein [Ectocarpus siliculosus]
MMSTAEVVEASVVGEEFEVKTDLLKQIDLSSSKQMRTEVNELMLKLEPMNPTDKPAASAILNGVWEFLYTGGLSPGTLAVQVLSRVAKTFSAVVDLKGITLTINRDQPRVEAAVKASVFGTEAQVKVRTRLEQKSDMRLQEVYEEAEVAGVTIPIPARIQPRRTLYITYLDDDIMIARDDTGAPDLLVRKQKYDVRISWRWPRSAAAATLGVLKGEAEQDFRFNTGTPSTSEEDDSSPGSG